MMLGASNTWFPLTLSVVSIPSESNSELEQLIAQHWSNLQQFLLSPEYHVLSNPDQVKSSPDFQIKEEPVPESCRNLIEKVVLAERLREVRALIGFTRIQSADQWETESLIQKEGPLEKGKLRIVPASEVRGEGLFLVFRHSALQLWTERLSAEIVASVLLIPSVWNIP